MKLFDNVAPAVRKETKFVAVSELIGVAVMLVVFAVLHGVMPDKVTFDYRVVLGGILGGIVAVANFFLLGLTVQKVSSTEDEKQASGYMKSSYTRRMLLQVIWMVIAIAAPFIQFVAGLVPLLFPGAAAKIRSILLKQNA